MHVLGLSAFTHDTSAVLLGDSGVAAAIEEKKLTRSRDSSGIPHAAIRFCLARAGVSWKDIGGIGVASRPLQAWRRRAWLHTRLFPLAPIASGYYHTQALGHLAADLNRLRRLRTFAENPSTPVDELEHHLCHAASAFYASPFERAAILTLDREGDGWSGLLAVGEGTRLRILRPILFPNSLGWVYSQFTELLGFQPFLHEHKTQWLSLEGQPVFLDLFLGLLRGGNSVLPRVQASYFRRGFAGQMAFSGEFFERLGLPQAANRTLTEELKRNLASSIQQACAVVATDLARWLREQTGARHLCVAGGLFLNGLIAEAVEKDAGFDQVFVQPAAGNEGGALGAAWLLWHERLGKPRGAPPAHLYWGPSYSNDEIKKVLDNCKCRYRWCNSEDEEIDGTIGLLEAGRIVAWYQGAAEFGPRALGNRSLLASPWAPYVKENLNEYVKHRESFRPFAVAVPEEDAARYFEAPAASRFMASMGRVHAEARPLLEGFLLPGDRVRLHVVERSANPLFWRLLKRFGERSPAPLLVNTSFNLFGEPLVVSPRDAVRSYFCSGVDALLIGSFLLSK